MVGSSNRTGNIYQRFSSFFEKPIWHNRMLFYFTIFIAVSLIFITVFGIFSLIFPDFNISGSDVNYDNQRYLLSALVQSLAAVIALVITMSLVAVQLAAQSYSARVIDVYKRNPDMWIILCIYIINIFYGIGLIKVVEVRVRDINMEIATFVAYFMGFFAFVCLIPYILKTLDLLKPSTVIQMLAGEITKEKISLALEEEREIAEKDPIQPIIDMVNGALERKDSETVRNGLMAITDTTLHIFDDDDFADTGDSKLISHIINHLEKFGMHAASRQDEDSTFSVVVNLEIMGSKAANLNLKMSSRRILIGLEKVGTKSAQQRIEGSTRRAVKAIERIGYRAAEHKDEGTVRRAVIALERAGTKAAEHCLEGAARRAAIALGQIGVISFDFDTGGVTRRTLDALEKIGLEAMKTELDMATLNSAEALGRIGNRAVEVKFERVERRAAEVLEKIGIRASERELSTVVGCVREELEFLLEESKKGDFQSVTETSSEALRKIKRIREEESGDEKTE